MGTIAEEKGDESMKICIVDDDQDFAVQVEGILKKYFANGREEVRITRYGEGGRLIDAIKRGETYDLCFTDVEMPGMDGLELAGRIHVLDGRIKIVLLTSYEKYALPSYKVRAYYYILKDAYEAEIPLVLDRLREERDNAEREGAYYSIYNDWGGSKVQLQDIVYLSKDLKYVEFHCRNGQVYKERNTLKDLYKKLPQDQFLLVDRGSVINMRYVSGWTQDGIKLDLGNGRIVVPVSRRLKVEVKDALARFWRKR